MKPTRHHYQPPRSPLTGVVAMLGGVVATAFVFLAVPLTHGSLPEFPDEQAPQKLIPGPGQIVSFNDEIADPEPEPVRDDGFDDGITDWNEGFSGQQGIRLNGPYVGEGVSEPKAGMPKAAAQPPRPVSKPSPRYPASLLGRRVEGEVRIECRVNSSGRVASVRVRTSSGFSELDDAALEALRKWKFRPAMRNGRRVGAFVIIPVVFKASSSG